MTIAAGFVCSDGVVLAADSQLTGVSKRYSAKTWWFPPTGDRTIALVGAGDTILIRRVRDEIRRQLKQSQSAYEILQLIDSVVFAVLAKDLTTAVQHEYPPLSLLVAIRTPEGLTLHENDSGTVFAPVDSGSQCIGCGAALGKYLANWLFAPGLPMSHARKVAAYLVRQAKDYDPDCGGATTVLMFPASLDIAPFFVNVQEIAALETKLEETKDHVRKLIVHGAGLLGIDFNKETSERREETLGTAVSAALDTRAALSGVTAVGLVGTVSTLKIGKVPDPLEGVIQPTPEPEE